MIKARVLAAVTMIVCAWGAWACHGAGAAVLEPSQDPFYVAPANLASLAPGTVIRSRVVTTRLTLELGAAPTSYQVLFRSTDATGDAIAAVATLVLPAHPAAGVRRLGVDNPAYDSLTNDCSPSYTLQTLTGASADDVPESLMLDRGWDVMIPDYEGQQAEWAVGPLEGHIELDAIRAFEQLGQGGLTPQTEVGIEGLSGGAIPTMWSDILLRSYAPDVHLAGISAADLPANLLAVAPRLDGSPFYAPLVGVMIGFNRAYPSLGLDSLLNANGKAFAEKLGTDAFGCGNLPEAAPFGKTSDYFNEPTAAALAALPQVQAAFSHSDVDTAPAFSAPAFLYAEIHDELTFIDQSDAAVAAQCAKGATIQYVRDEIGEHLLAAKAAFQMISYLSDRFNGGTPPDTCPPVAATTPPQYHLKATERTLPHTVRITVHASVTNGATTAPVSGALVIAGAHRLHTSRAGVSTLTVKRTRRAGSMVLRLIAGGKTVVRARVRIP